MRVGRTAIGRRGLLAQPTRPDRPATFLARAARANRAPMPGRRVTVRPRPAATAARQRPPARRRVFPSRGWSPKRSRRYRPRFRHQPARVFWGWRRRQGWPKWLGPVWLGPCWWGWHLARVARRSRARAWEYLPRGRAGVRARARGRSQGRSSVGARVPRRLAGGRRAGEESDWATGPPSMGAGRQPVGATERVAGRVRAAVAHRSLAAGLSAASWGMPRPG